MNNNQWYTDFNKYFNQTVNSVINKHHFESYNSFIKDLETGEMLNHPYFKLIKKINNTTLHIIIDKQDIEIRKKKDNVYSEFSPNECRLNNSDYLLEVIIKKILIRLKTPQKTMDLDIIEFDKNEEFILCKIPIQVLSDYCILNINTKNKTLDEYRNELYKNGECINELGGYFIIDGKEKLIISQERLAYNKLYTHGDSSKKYILITEVKSAEIESFSPAKNTYVKLKKMINKKNIEIENDIIEETKKTENNEDIEDMEDVFTKHNNIQIDKDNISILVSFPGLKDDIPLFIIFRALGYESDKEIYDFILKDLLPYNNYKEDKFFTIHNDKYNEFCNFLEYSRIDAIPIMNRKSAIEYIHRKLDKQIYGKGDIKISELVLSVIYNNFLPHQKTTISKAMYLGYMVFNLLKVQLKYENITNRDTFEYKQIETSGYLLSTLFREYYIKFKNSILNKLINELELDRKRIDDLNVNVDRIKNLFKNNENMITDGFKKAFKGNWGVRDTQKTLTQDNLNETINRDRYSFNKEGLVQDLLRISYLQTISHLRRIQTPIDSNMKIIGPRRLNATQWGYVCPVDTPDGGNSGLIKNMAIGCIISLSNKQAHSTFIRLFENTEGFISFKNDTKPSLYVNHTKIFVNGCLIGIYVNENILEIVEFLKLIKRNNLNLNGNENLNQISIAFNYEYKELYILTDFGRCIRLIYVLEKLATGDNILIRNETHNNSSWKNLISGSLEDSENKTISGSIKSFNQEIIETNKEKLKSTQAPIEYIDPQESLYTLICLEESKINEKNYKYLELNGKLIFGALPSIIPFMNHNPKTRNLFCMAQAKQSVGIFATNFNKRMDTMGHILHYPQTPLVLTKISNEIKYNDMPGGSNVVIAIASYTGYNQEDSVILNKSALDRGLFTSSYYRTYIEYIENEEFFEVPENISRKTGNNYDKLDPETGIIKNNEYVTDNDIIIGKTSKLDGNTIDKSTTIHHNDFGVVDGIFSGQQSDKNKFCKVRIRMERTPEFADKFGSRHGLKGVVGMILNQEDMPFSKDGIVPDIIINPHGVPSRMSTGHLLECITGKSCSLLGSFYDASPFENKNELENITGIMETLDYEQYGNDILYNGYNGEQIHASIFMGVQYYQRMKHMVHDKVQSRDIGPKTVLERQPAKGRAREGGLRLGEMERDSLISHGASNFLKESYTVRSDNYKCYICKMCGRIGVVNPQKNIYSCKFCNNNYSFDEVRMPYCTKLFIQEMESQFVSMRLVTDKY